MMMSSRRCLCSVMVFVLAGCSHGETTSTVTGKVLVDGQPLTIGTVVFTPDAAKGNTSMHEPRGKLDANGVFHVFQTKDGGAVSPGWYKISIRAQRLKDPTDRYSQMSVIPTKFASPETSGLTLEVVDHPAPVAYDITLSAKEP